MPELFVTDRRGEEARIEVTSGQSLMEVLREAASEIDALCGGTCSCASCHIYVTGGPVALLPPISEDEDSLLDGSCHRQEESRLSCQIPMTDELTGLRLTIAPED